MGILLNVKKDLYSVTQMHCQATKDFRGILANVVEHEQMNAEKVREMNPLRVGTGRGCTVDALSYNFIGLNKTCHLYKNVLFTLLFTLCTNIQTHTIHHQ